MAHKEFILWFKEINKDDSSLVGGKAANLGEMFSKFSIPDGFCITVALFEKFLENADIKIKINSYLQNVDFNDLKKLNSVSQKIRKFILNSKTPNYIKELIVKNYRKINDFVAVRSSAVAEDTKEASFAGQQATFLNVIEKNLLKSIKECWASFYSTRAILYRHKNKFNHEPKIAVAVQKMVNSQKSGVIFTVNPVTKNKNEMIIESVFGLGESIVSGVVTPDYYVINKGTNQILKEVINEKKLAIIRENDKNKKIRLNKKKANSNTLNKQELNQLIKEALLIEKHYKKPMDIEWAIDDKVYILQARPVTTL